MNALTTEPYAEWHLFLSTLEKQFNISKEFAEHIRYWWAEFTKNNIIPLPIADMTTDKERFQFTWNYKHLLLEIEISDNGNIEWFGIDKQIKETMYGFAPKYNKPPEKLTNYLNKVK